MKGFVQKGNAETCKPACKATNTPEIDHKWVGVMEVNEGQESLDFGGITALILGMWFGK